MNKLTLYNAGSEGFLPLLFTEGISCGFPSPASDFEAKTIDLNSYVIKHPAATFFARAAGDSMENAGISDGDIMVIDRSLRPDNGKIAICVIDGEFTAKRIRIIREEIWLIPENKSYQPVLVNETATELIIWGIVTHVLKTL